jgi:hypothetical protein
VRSLHSIDAPCGVDLIPSVVAIEDPWSDDAHVGSQGGRGEIAPRTDSEISHVAEVDWLATLTAGLVARHDLDMQAALAPVVGVQHVPEAAIRFHGEGQVAVMRRLLDLPDDPLKHGAGAEHLQPVGCLHTVQWVPLANAASNGVSPC